MTLFYHVGKNGFRHGAAADIAVANEEYLNHKFLLSQSAMIRPIMQGFIGVSGTLLFLSSCHTLRPIMAYRSTSFPRVVVKT